MPILSYSEFLLFPILLSIFFFLHRRKVINLEKKLKKSETDLQHITTEKKIFEATSSKEKEFLQNTIHTLKATEASWQQSFENIANKVMKGSEQNIAVRTTQLFENFQKHIYTNFSNQEKNFSKMEGALKDALGAVNKRMENMSKEQHTLEETLKTQNKMLLDAQSVFKGQAERIMHALKTPHVRGQWGEIQLRRIVELAGMEAYCDFATQQSSHTEGKTVRPDLLIKLPEKRHIIVDAKAPLGSYLEGLEQSSPQDRNKCMSRHAKNLLAHVNLLSQKKYWESFSFSPEFVILFLPGESFLSTALEQDPSLLERATNASVIIATPTTLIALLKAVHYGWKNIEISENIKYILDISSTLLTRIRTFEEHFEKLGRCIDSTQNHFHKTARSLESRLIPAAQKLRSVGVTPQEEPSPDLDYTQNDELKS